MHWMEKEKCDEMISTFLSQLAGIVVLFPFIIMIVLLVIYRGMGKAPAKVIGHTADLTTPFLFLSIYIMANTIFSVGVGFYIAMIALIIMIVYAVIERKNVKDFRVKRLLRKVWRFLFIVLAIAYLVLLVLGIVLKVFEYVN